MRELPRESKQNTRRVNVMTAGDTNGDSASASSQALATAILRAAQAVERAEHLIKAEILKAAEHGDTGRIKTVVGRWMTEPVTRVLGPDPPETTPSSPELENLPDDSRTPLDDARTPG